MTENNYADIAYRAVGAAGGPQEVSKKCGVTVDTVYYWLKKGVPPQHVMQLEILTHHRFKAREIRPDVFCPAFAQAKLLENQIEAEEK